MKGKIQKYFSSRKYGFIETDESEDNIFFHKSNYRSHDMPSIGQNVEFKIVETPKGNEAKDIKVIKSGTEAVQEQEIKAEETLSEEEQPKETPEVIEDLDQITGVEP